MTTHEVMLVKDRQYDVTTLRCTGWSDGDGSGHEGYNWLDYFTDDGKYLGADEHGIEPIFEAR